MALLRLPDNVPGDPSEAHWADLCRLAQARPARVRRRAVLGRLLVRLGERLGPGAATGACADG